MNPLKRCSLLTQWLRHHLRHAHRKSEGLDSSSNSAPSSTFLLIYTLGSSRWWFKQVAPWYPQGRMGTDYGSQLGVSLTLAVVDILGMSQGTGVHSVFMFLSLSVPFKQRKRKLGEKKNFTKRQTSITCIFQKQIHKSSNLPKITNSKCKELDLQPAKLTAILSWPLKYKQSIEDLARHLHSGL